MDLRLSTHQPSNPSSTLHVEVILDRGETPNKCTIAPLHYRPDFTLIRITSEGQRLPPFHSDYLLHPNGRCLTELSIPPGSPIRLAAVDSIWRRLDPILVMVDGEQPPLVRLPPGFVTAYPRRSRLAAGDPKGDPDGGLATIEAIFAAAALMGHWDPSLLAEYFFGSQFVTINRETFSRLGVPETLLQTTIPFAPRLPRNSQTRRLSRGRRCAQINQT